MRANKKNKNSERIRGFEIFYFSLAEIVEDLPRVLGDSVGFFEVYCELNLARLLDLHLRVTLVLMVSQVVAQEREHGKILWFRGE